MPSIQTLSNRFAPVAVGTNEIPWPPSPEDAERIRMYEIYQAVMDGDHVNAFNDRPEQDRYKTYITCNLSEIIAKASTDILFGEEVGLEFDDNVSEEKIRRVNAIWDRNIAQRVFYEVALDGAGTGDGLLQVRTEGDSREAIIEPVSVNTWYPECSPDNARQVIRHRLAWVRLYRNPKGDVDELIRMVIHERGLVRNELWLLDGDKLVRRYMPGTDQWDQIVGSGVTEEVVTPAPDDFLLVHIPNYRLARDFFGRSDFMGKLSMFSSVDARITQTDAIMTNHADPILVVPEGTEDETGELDKSQLDFVLYNEDTAGQTSYVTWDGSLNENLEYIDRLTKKILMLTETSPALLGIQEAGGGQISGRALKLMSISTLAKANRRRLYWTKAIQDVLRIAQLVEGETDPVVPHIKWPDGLPQDILEAVEVEGQRILQGTQSRRGAIKSLDSVGDKAVDAKLAEIADEDETDTQAVRASGAAQPGRPEIKVEVADLGSEG